MKSLPLGWALVLALLPAARIAAQTTCTTSNTACDSGLNANSPREGVWKLHQRLNVYIDPAYAAQLGPCRANLEDVFIAWAASSANAMFGVSFSWADPAPGAPDSVLITQRTQSDAADFSPGKDFSTESPGLLNAVIYLNSGTTNCDAMAHSVSHEVGHGFGLLDCNKCCNTVMHDASGGLNDTSGPLYPTSCDTNAIKRVWDPILQQESGTTADCGGLAASLQCVPNDDPLLLDLAGDGVHLTAAGDGVAFDVNADGAAERVSWTAAGSDDGWLVLDRNANGTIDDGTELFGNRTPQPGSAEPNGYLALAEFDKRESGGDGDGVITDRDAVWPRLRVWQDRNHDGISQATELLSLPTFGVVALDLSFSEFARRDQHGNYFRYRAEVKDATRGPKVGRWAFDVFLRKAR